MDDKINIEPTPMGLRPDIHTEIDDAAERFDMPKLVQLLRLPEDVIRGVRKMRRKERREWYRLNKTRLKLPEWSKLETLNKEI